MKTMHAYLIVIVCAMIHCAAFSNNLQLGAPSLSGNRTLSFNVYWENSWNLTGISDPGNHDAVWIFVKYREGNSEWKHLGLSYLSADHASSDPVVSVKAVTDGKGVFIDRTGSSTGTSMAEITLKLLDPLLPGNYEFRVFGIEMVYIPEGEFYLGDSISINTFRKGNSPSPYFVGSEDAIVRGTGPTHIYNGGTYSPAADIPASYPKGYDAFYCMKYEITQQQWVDFLNTLTYDQQATRTAIPPDAPPGTIAMTSANAHRTGIVVVTTGLFGNPSVYGMDASNDTIFNGPGDGGTRSCNFMSWADLAAYLDWAALRPMTEFEFEKVCRGPAYPVAREFAWATPGITDANTLRDDGTEYEASVDTIPAGNGIGNHGYAGPQGPLRAGFAGSDTSDRLTIGASYYGVLEMSGNLWEQCINVTSTGLQFQRNNGDGTISATGSANTPTWPANTAVGAGVRGGAWNSGISTLYRDLAVSDRYYAGQAPTPRKNTTGGRGVR